MPNESLIAAPSARINARTDIARTAARCRAVMRLSADGVRFRSASEPVRASLVFFHASLGSEIDNAITLLHAAPTASARRRCTYWRRNETKRKFFNDFSRARARVRARRGGFQAASV